MVGAMAFAAGCSNGDDYAPGGESEMLPSNPQVVEVEPPAAVISQPLPEPLVEGEDAEGMDDPMEVGEGVAGCATPDRVSGAPQSIPEALNHMNALPRPVTLACFLQSLKRPLDLYMTSSGQSLQPSPGARSPRTFIVNGPLVMSVVPDGEARNTLELGFRTTPNRSIKTEVLFPLTAEVSPATIFERVQQGTGTLCGGCHVAEVHTEYEAFPGGVFESDIIPPSPVFEVGLDEVRAEEAECDPQLESGRCGILAALFQYGEVRQATIWSEE
jgi:hypothetical protein